MRVKTQDHESRQGDRRPAIHEEQEMGNTLVTGRIRLYSSFTYKFVLPSQWRRKVFWDGGAKATYQEIVL